MLDDISFEIGKEAYSLLFNLKITLMKYQEYFQ